MPKTATPSPRRHQPKKEEPSHLHREIIANGPTAQTKPSVLRQTPIQEGKNLLKKSTHVTAKKASTPSAITRSKVLDALAPSNWKTPFMNQRTGFDEVVGKGMPCPGDHEGVVEAIVLVRWKREKVLLCGPCARNYMLLARAISGCLLTCVGPSAMDASFEDIDSPLGLTDAGHQVRTFVSEPDGLGYRWSPALVGTEETPCSFCETGWAHFIGTGSAPEDAPAGCCSGCARFITREVTGLKVALMRAEAIIAITAEMCRAVESHNKYGFMVFQMP